jgi:hypothetical protein
VPYERHNEELRLIQAGILKISSMAMTLDKRLVRDMSHIWKMRLWWRITRITPKVHVYCFYSETLREDRCTWYGGFPRVHPRLLFWLLPIDPTRIYGQRT